MIFIYAVRNNWGNFTFSENTIYIYYIYKIKGKIDLFFHYLLHFFFFFAVFDLPRSVSHAVKKKIKESVDLD